MAELGIKMTIEYAGASKTYDFETRPITWSRTAADQIAAELERCRLVSPEWVERTRDCLRVADLEFGEATPAQEDAALRERVLSRQRLRQATYEASSMSDINLRRKLLYGTASPIFTEAEARAMLGLAADPEDP